MGEEEQEQLCTGSATLTPNPLYQEAPLPAGTFSFVSQFLHCHGQEVTWKLLKLISVQSDRTGAETFQKAAR